MRKTLELVAEFRKHDADTPIVLMGYYNPIYVFPNEAFLDEAAKAGVDGMIVVDVPPEADDELALPAVEQGLNFIRLATPTTDDKRLPAVLKNTSGFVYYVSITGITGAAAPNINDVKLQVARIKTRTELPVVVGFGVRTPEQAAAIAQGADGVVVGSALVSTIEKSPEPSGQATGKTVPAVLDLVKSLSGPCAPRKWTNRLRCNGRLTGPGRQASKGGARCAPSGSSDGQGSGSRVRVSRSARDA